MSLARQFGLEPSQSTRVDGKPCLAACLKSRAQLQSSAVSMKADDIDDSRVVQSNDGSISFVVYVDTTNALAACKSVIEEKGFYQAELSDASVLIVPRDGNSRGHIGFQLSVECHDDSPCISRITFSAPRTYLVLSSRDVAAWNNSLRDLFKAIVVKCQ